ncbi:MAG: F0F1 ATP synthase subunit delta [Verrucomicrobiota bacterium]
MAKASKDAIRTARQMLQSCLVDGRLDEGRAKRWVQKISSAKPRGYLGILDTFLRMLRMEAAKHHAVVESAAELDAGVKETVTADLRAKYGSDLDAEFRVDSELLGGMRVRVGSDVWDGSVRGRLARLSDKF